MAKVTVAELAKTLKELETQVAEITRRLEELEGRKHVDEVAAAARETPPAVAPVVGPGITEEELLAISAAIGAFLGIQAHIRYVRLVSTNAWSQQGRLSIQASHSLHE